MVVSPASRTDIAPTLLDLAGAPALAGAQGRSLRPLLEGHDDEWRTALLVEEDQPYGLDVLPGPVRIRTVVTEDLRYTRIAGTRIAELYNLGSDPDERVNLADVDTALRRSADAAMVDELMRVVDDSAVPFHAA